MKPIAVIGSLNMDLVVRTARVPQGGETITGSAFALIPGGKGANQAVAAARAGASVRMIGAVGDDAFAPALLASLSAAGMDVTGVARLSDTPTGTATILLEDNGENRIIIVPGANGRVTPQALQPHLDMLRQAGFILLQHEIPAETNRLIIEVAHTAGVPVLLNPAPFRPVPPDLLQKIDTLVLNEVEASMLTGQTISSPEQATQAAWRMLEMGAQTAIITLGKAGAVLCQARAEVYQPAFNVTALDTTAAGDTFTGAYAAHRLRGQTARQALRFASAAAALCVTRLGAQTSIPTFQEIEDFLSDKPAGDVSGGQ